MEKILCAVIGVGYLGKFHAAKYAALPDAELIAVCDINENRCHEIAALYKAEPVIDYKELLGKVQAVSIAVPTVSHYEIARDFLQHNTHVLVEKPITTTIEEAKELIDLAKSNKLVLQVGHLERFNPVLRALKNILQRPLFIESLRLAPYKLRATDVNVVLDLMIHDIDLLQHLVNAPIKQIHASGAPVLSDKVDIATARIEFTNDCIANVTASRISAKPERNLRIFQPNAYISGDLHNQTLGIHRKGDNEMFPGIPEIIRENLTLQNGDALFAEIQSFLKAITTNIVPEVTGEDGMHALATAIQITQIVADQLKGIIQE